MQNSGREDGRREGERTGENGRGKGNRKEGMFMVAQERRRGGIWPVRAAMLGVALVVFLFLLPLLLLPGEERGEREPLPTATLSGAVPTEAPVGAAAPVTGWDEGERLRLLTVEGTIEEMTLGEYLWGVTAAEMPASFELEALKAQTVAARTYCMYQRSGGGEKHPGADVCGDYTCCQAYLTKEQASAGWGVDAYRYGEKISRAVAETDGLFCLYEGEPIDAVFFSSAAGRTVDALAVWGTEVPYLRGVESPEGEEVPGWQTVVTFSPAEFREKLLGAYPQADLSGEAAGWIGELVTDEGGMVTSVTMGGVEMSGGQARSLLGLRSAHFTAGATEEEVTFQVTGYGHGVGMSQYGANAMAREGKSFQEILEWYYTGAKVGEMEREK